MVGGGGKPLGDSVFAGPAAAGAVAISASAVSVHSLDTVKTLLQASTDPYSPVITLVFFQGLILDFPPCFGCLCS
jgi:hypothetical protein